MNYTLAITSIISRRTHCIKTYTSVLLTYAKLTYKLYVRHTPRCDITTSVERVNSDRQYLMSQSELVNPSLKIQTSVYLLYHY